jgi:hypothetical protein
VIRRCDKEHGIGEMVQQRTSCFGTNSLEAKRLTLDVRDTARHFRKEALSESGLL